MGSPRLTIRKTRLGINEKNHLGFIVANARYKSDACLNKQYMLYLYAYSITVYIDAVFMFCRSQLQILCQSLV